jgi:ABC-type bacteriocin/lantibiotic exporter with double-glycine peptidase domain
MTFHRQETKFTCGPASVRNTLLAYGYNFSERKIRELAGSDRIKGTSEKKIFKALRQLGFKFREFQNRSEAAFKQRGIYNLKKGNTMVVLTDHEDHWVSVVEYGNKYLTVIDPEQKRVRMHLTPKSFSKWCLNFNKRSKDTYYYGIIILKPKEE